MRPADRAAFERYWASAQTEVRIDPPVRDYLYRLMMLEYLFPAGQHGIRPAQPLPDHRVPSAAIPGAHAATQDPIRPAIFRVSHPDGRVGQPPAATAGRAVPV